MGSDVLDRGSQIDSDNERAFEALLGLVDVAEGRAKWYRFYNAVNDELIHEAFVPEDQKDAQREVAQSLTGGEIAIMTYDREDARALLQHLEETE